MLVTEPIVFLFALWTAFTFLAVFLFFDAIPVVFSTSYGFNVQPFGAVFTALFVGTFIGTMASAAAKPEGRLAFACVESILVPIALF
ncbi:MAG: hypothetical protein LQ340_007842 [Diploschistes diacapsis]|nr:MAG: hypothetical protein LQ340_007842 [Diploschistes diacapsis]